MKATLRTLSLTRSALVVLSVFSYGVTAMAEPLTYSESESVVSTTIKIVTCEADASTVGDHITVSGAVSGHDIHNVTVSTSSEFGVNHSFAIEASTADEISSLVELDPTYGRSDLTGLDRAHSTCFNLSGIHDVFLCLPKEISSQKFNAQMLTDMTQAHHELFVVDTVCTVH